ncbi:MAG: ABC transporter ATP-binding protein [Phycisphaerales bacterium]|nr:ABC transporter ATP-binding protein [Phycisphaerales bacterium]
MLRAHNLSFTFDGRPVLSAVDAEFPAGTLTAVIGPNGAGKSTLLRLLAGLLTPASGGVSLGDEAIPSIPPFRRARQLAYMPQRSEVAFPFSAREVVALGRFASEHSPADTIAAALAIADVSDRADDCFGVLSAGQQQRVTLARALAQLGVGEAAGTLSTHSAARALLADEPVAALDPIHVAGTLSLLRRLARAGLSVVVVVHDLSLVLEYCDLVLALDGAGRVAGKGDPRRTLTPELLRAVFGTTFRAARDEAGQVVALLPDAVPGSC